MLGVTGVLLALLAQATVPSPPASNPGFPRYDRAAWELQRKGLTAKAADRNLRSAPDTIETFGLLLAADRAGDALRTLRRIVDGHPGQMAQAFEMVSRAPGGALRDDGWDHQAVLQTIVEAGFLRVPALPREEAARSERQLMMVDARPLPGGSFQDRLAQFIEKYRGTEAATLAELEILGRRPVKDQLEAFDAFIRDHPNGLVGAKALYDKGWYLSSTAAINGIEPRNADPTERFMRVVEIASQLQSGRFPPSYWVDRAPTLVTSFFWSTPTFSPPNINRVLEVFSSFLRARSGTFAPHDWGGPEYLVTERMADLFARSGEGVAGVDRMMLRFEQESGDRLAADYLQAVLSLSRLNSRGYFYKGEPVTLTEEERRARTERATQALDALSRGDNQYTRWALATLATFHFEQLDFARARVRYREYVNRFPAGDYAWLAALRTGECAEALGDTAGAVEAYRAAATRRGTDPLAIAMGRVAAGRLFESQERPDAALEEYRRALASWDNDYGREFILNLHPKPAPSRAEALDDQLSVTQLWLRQRIERLTTALASPVAAQLERGRWLLEQGRWADARLEFERVASGEPRSALVGAARYGTHVARLRQALELLKTETESAVAMRELQAIAADPYDFVVSASKIARASLLRIQGLTDDADALMNPALSEWQNQQRGRAGAAATALDRDVFEIRRLIFQPARKRPYLIVSSDVDVTLADGEQVVVSNAQPLPGLDVLFLDHEQAELLQSIARVFRSTQTDPPERPMYQLLEWWQTFFESGPSGWGQIHVETHPYIWRLDFTNPERTRAAARVSTGPSAGRTVVLEQIRGVWQIVRAGPGWIS